MNRPAERGVALIAAIFLVVIIGGGVVLLSTLSLRSSQQTTQNLLQIRAQLSVAAALEYGVQRLVEGDTCADLDATNNIALTIEAFPGFVTTLNCVQNDYIGPPPNVTSILTMGAVTEWGSANDDDYVWAQLESTIEL
jgi:hypothetical protein